MSDEPEESQWPALITLGEIVVAVYIPFVWTLFSKVPVLPDHRIGSFLLMPTFLPNTFLSALRGSSVFELLCPMLALFTVAGLACWGRHGGARRTILLGCVLVGSLLLSIGTAILLHWHSVGSR